MNLKVYGKNRELWQWDTDQMLIVEGAAECQQVHFSRPGDISCPVVQIREHNGHRVADIPNLYLQQPGKFYAFLCGINGSEGQTYHREKFVIRERPRPDTYVYNQTQVLRYENLENRVTALEDGSGGGFLVATFTGEIVDGKGVCACDRTIDEVWNGIKAGIVQLQFVAPALGIDVRMTHLKNTTSADNGKGVYAYDFDFNTSNLAMGYEFRETGYFRAYRIGYDGKQTTTLSGTVTWATE